MDGSANMEISSFKQQCIMIPFILELAQHFRTYKCFVLTSLSNPGFELVETGICPDNWLADKSNQMRFERRPSVGGILPVNWFEFRALHEWNSSIELYHLMNRIMFIEDFRPNLSEFLQECELS